MSNNDQRDNWTMALDCHDHECRFWILNCFCAYPLNGVLRLCSQTGEMLWENFSGSNSQGDNVLHSDNYKNNAQHLILQKWEFLGEFLATFGRSLKWHGRNMGRQLFFVAGNAILTLGMLTAETFPLLPSKSTFIINVDITYSVVTRVSHLSVPAPCVSCLVLYLYFYICVFAFGKNV